MGELTRLFSPQTRPSYRGTVERKLPVMQRYRFAICFENARETPEYSSEQIFDAFAASCIPVLLGRAQCHRTCDLLPASLTGCSASNAR